MKIAIICDVLGVPNNGTSIASYNLINYLKKAGHEVHVVCSDEDKIGVEGYHVVPHLNLGPINAYVKKNGVALSKGDKKILEPLIKEMDLIHTEMPFSLSVAAVKLARKYNIPITSSCHVQAENCTSHVFMMRFELANYAMYKIFYHNVYKHAISVHYPSKFICDYLVERGYKAPKPYVITNGVNPGIYPIQVEKPDSLKGKFVILYTARYVKEKYQKILIDAMKYTKYQDKIQLVFAGGGPNLAKLEKRAEKLNLKNKVMFRFFPRVEMNNVINYADLYVHPSNIEIEAIAANEAVSCGLVPVISNSKKSAAPMFAIDENNLFKASSPKDLAKRIDFWIENPELKAKQKEEYLSRRNPLSVEEAMIQMEQMILDSYRIFHERKKALEGK